MLKVSITCLRFLIFILLWYQLYQMKILIKVDNGWIRTWVLWCQKRLVCKVWHNHSLTAQHTIQCLIYLSLVHISFVNCRMATQLSLNVEWFGFRNPLTLHKNVWASKPAKMFSVWYGSNVLWSSFFKLPSTQRTIWLLN